MIHNYSHKPDPIFRYCGNENQTKTLTLGLEVEVDQGRAALRTDRYDLSDRLDAITNILYCKSDASLGNGLEIVTHPCSLKYHMTELKWKQILQTCVKAGFRSHDTTTCGLHVHVGRAQLGADEREQRETIRKIIILVNRYWDYIVPATRRTDSALSDWAPRPDLWWYNTDLTGEALKELATGNIRTRIDDHLHHSARYTAVNVNNSNTIEFRIYRGTLKRDSLIAALQLTHNICSWAMTHSWDDIQNSSWEDVALYKSYNELNWYLAKLDLLSEEFVPDAPIRSSRLPDFVGPDGI